MPPPLTDTARRVLAPGYYTEYSKLVGDALSLQKQDLDRQRNMFEMERARIAAEQDDIDRQREEASRASLQTVAAEISQLDPADPDFARRRMEIISRNPDALYNRAASAFLGVSEEAAAEPRYMRQQQAQESAAEKRRQDQELAAQRRADEAFARSVALKSGDRGSFERWKLAFGKSKTEEERAAATEELAWQEQQDQFERELAAAGLPDYTKLKEAVPGKVGQRYYGPTARRALDAALAKKASLNQELEVQRVIMSLQDRRDKALDETTKSDLQTQINTLQTRLGKSAAEPYLQPPSASSATSPAGSKIP